MSAKGCFLPKGYTRLEEKAMESLKSAEFMMQPAKKDKAKCMAIHRIQGIKVDL